MIKLKRLLHLIFGHSFSGSKRLDKLQTENHPHTCADYIYTINIMECKCGLTFFDAGVESRKGYKL